MVLPLIPQVLPASCDTAAITGGLHALIDTGQVGRPAHLACQASGRCSRSSSPGGRQLMLEPVRVSESGRPETSTGLGTPIHRHTTPPGRPSALAHVAVRPRRRPLLIWRFAVRPGYVVAVETLWTARVGR